MQGCGLKFHHLGLAVSNKDKAIKFLVEQGYQCGESVFDPLQGVDLLMCVHPDMPDVELIYHETETDAKSPIQSLLKERSEMIYHLCYTSVSIQASMANIKERGIRVFPMAPKKPAVLFGDKCVAFYYVDGFGLIEILEEGS